MKRCYFILFIFRTIQFSYSLQRYQKFISQGFHISGSASTKVILSINQFVLYYIFSQVNLLHFYLWKSMAYRSYSRDVKLFFIQKICHKALGVKIQTLHLIYRSNVYNWYSKLIPMSYNLWIEINQINSKNYNILKKNAKIQCMKYTT